MPALSYQKRFAVPVLLGLYNYWMENPANRLTDRPPNILSMEMEPEQKEAFPKRQTIRATRKSRPFKKGDRLYHYYAMRTKQCKKLGESICTSVEDIEIRRTKKGVRIYLDGIMLSNDEAEILAKQDGFTGFEQMQRWWGQTHDLPFKGQLIKW